MHGQEVCAAPAPLQQHGQQLEWARPLSSLAGLQVLVVEDNAINQQVAREFIEDAGAVVHCVENGALAVQHVAGHRVDLMLMDLQMPEMDGIEATRRLRAAGHAMPIVAMTASAMPEDRERCLQTGMNDYVSKPLDVEQLAAALARDYPFLEAGHVRRLAHAYGREAWRVLGKAAALADLGRPFGATLTQAEVRYLMAQEWARTAEDVVWRRSKLGLRLSAAEVAALDEWMREAVTAP